ncbi:hypothetical protein [Oecophyllibacter saccharovorans]|uniref:hypothetical protein n=1 Tax=Oecophyllibacter saccharovorans TaxID=2558360 RepID=UPI001142A5A6|nr:hypothetical protein [Oecophyllibacter saccharovorans]QDH14971.1 hypothetical protein E3E11_02820 [Oecophyllibacter saccharovorans]TPW35156.1 hypothetical protein E3203_06750 [Oecophyllibacter saccharovorans]
MTQSQHSAASLTDHAVKKEPREHPLVALIRLGLLALMVGVAMIVVMVCGNLGHWYLAWILGTMMIVLISACGAILFDHQEEIRHNAGNREY